MSARTVSNHESKLEQTNQFQRTSYANAQDTTNVKPVAQNVIKKISSEGSSFSHRSVTSDFGLKSPTDKTRKVNPNLRKSAEEYSKRQSRLIASELSQKFNSPDREKNGRELNSVLLLPKKSEIRNLLKEEVALNAKVKVEVTDLLSKEKIALDTHPAPNYQLASSLLDLGVVLSFNGLKSKSIEEVAKDVLYIYITNPASKLQIVKQLKTIWSFGCLAQQVARAKDPNTLHQAEDWLEKYNQFLVVLAGYDQGAELLCSYFRQFADQNSDHPNTIVQLIYTTYRSKILEMMSFYTSEDLKLEQSDTLFRNATLSGSLCAYFLRSQLIGTLTELTDFLAKKLKKPAKFHYEKKTKKHLKLIIGFLNQFYSSQLFEIAQSSIKIRAEALVKRFKESKSAEDLAKIIQSGVSQLLFLSVVNPFLLNSFKGDTSKTQNGKNSDKNLEAQAREDIVVKITKLIQSLANQTAPSEYSNISKFIPIYKQFLGKHQETIAKMLD